MLSAATMLAIFKMAGNGLALAAALVSLVEAKEQRKFELARELGTVREHIKDAEMTGQDTVSLRKRYNTINSQLEVIR